MTCDALEARSLEHQNRGLQNFSLLSLILMVNPYLTGLLVHLVIWHAQPFGLPRRDPLALGEKLVLVKLYTAVRCLYCN